MQMCGGALCVSSIRQSRVGVYFRIPGHFMKRSVAAASFLMFLLAWTCAAMASTATWQDTWTDPVGRVLLNADNWYYPYTHDINDDGFDVGEDFVTHYDLAIGLYDDAECDRSEWAWIDLPGLVTDGIVKIGYEDIQRGWSIAGLISLNTTGTLGVAITRLTGDFYFGESRPSMPTAAKRIPFPSPPRPSFLAPA